MVSEDKAVMVSARVETENVDAEGAKNKTKKGIGM